MPDPTEVTVTLKLEVQDGEELRAMAVDVLEMDEDDVRGMSVQDLAAQIVRSCVSSNLSYDDLSMKLVC